MLNKILKFFNLYQIRIEFFRKLPLDNFPHSAIHIPQNTFRRHDGRVCNIRLIFQL